MIYSLPSPSLISRLIGAALLGLSTTVCLQPAHAQDISNQTTQIDNIGRQAASVGSEKGGDITINADDTVNGSIDRDQNGREYGIYNDK